MYAKEPIKIVRPLLVRCNSPYTNEKYFFVYISINLIGLLLLILLFVNIIIKDSDLDLRYV